MRNFRKRKIWRSILESWPALGILSAGLVFFAWTVIGLLGKMVETRENKELAESKIIELENQKAELSSEIEKLNTATGIEASIREKFGLVKEGEGEIIIVENETPPDDTEKSSSGFFSFIKSWFD